MKRVHKRHVVKAAEIVAGSVTAAVEAVVAAEVMEAVGAVVGVAAAEIAAAEIGAAATVGGAGDLRNARERPKKRNEQGHDATQALQM
ncbi:MAG: hypothetical protein ACRD33_08515 [Candidatus Acidiferrales bacterium]